MGLLDPIFNLTGGLLGANATPEQQMALSAGLLQGTGNVWANLGAGISNAAAMRQQQQAQERQNRANDLQQVTGLYSALKNADLVQMLQDNKAGIPHVRNPQLAQIEQRMAQLAGMPGLASGGPGAGLLGGGMPQAGAPGRPMAGPSGGLAQGGGLTQGAPRPSGLLGGGGQDFLGSNPDYQPLPMQMGQAPQFQQMPQPSGQVPQSQTLEQPRPQQGQQADPFGDLRSEADIYAAMANKPELIAENRYKLSLPQLSRGVSFNAGTGRPIAGLVDNVPIQYDQNGRPQVIPSGIPQAIADRAGMVSGAQTAATSPYKTVQQTDASGAVRQMFLPQIPGYPGAPQAPQLPGRSPFPQLPDARAQLAQLPPLSGRSQIPPEVLAADRSGSPFVATQRPGGPVQFQQPPQGAKPNAEPDPWATMPKLQVPQGLGQSTYSHSISERQAEMASRLSDELGTQAGTSSQRIAINNQARDALLNADTGFLAGHIADFRNVLASVGVPDQAFKATNDQVLTKDLVNAALQKGKTLFGARFTQSEVGIMLTRASPAPEMQKVAIKFLLDSDNAVQGYSVKQAQDFNRYLNTGGDPFQFKSWYAGAFPVTKTLEQVALPGGPAQALPANSVQLPNGKTYNFPSPEAAARFRAHIGGAQ